MPRTAPIRITKNDKREHARLARNTKSKIRNVQGKYGIDLSSEISIPSMDEFRSRKEFNEWKDSAKSFTNRNNQSYQFRKNDQGVVASKAQINRITKNNKHAILLAEKSAEEIAKHDFYVGGKKEGKVGQVMKQMGRPLIPAISKPKPFDFNKVADQKKMEELDTSMQNRSNPEYFDKRTAKMKSVFERELEENFNSDAKELLELLEHVPLDDFYYMYLENEEFDYALFYPPEGVEDDGSSLKALRKIENVLKRYWQGKQNFDLRDF